MDTKIYRHVVIVNKSQAGQRLDTLLIAFPFAGFPSPSRSTLQKWIADGYVKVNDTITSEKSYRVKIGDSIGLDVTIQPDIEIPPPEPLDIRIVYQDEHIVVLDKPPGITSHPVKGAMTGSVVNFLHYRKISLPPSSNPLRSGIVHRLDKNTSGLMVVACTDGAMSALIEMIKRREVERDYLAIVLGNPPLNSGTIERPIGRHETNRKKMAVTHADKGRPARTRYRVLSRYPAFSLVACKLDTGRTHQIRVHMSHFGYPVAGDPKYGGRKAHERVTKILKNMSKRDPDYPLHEKILEQIAGIIASDQVHLLHAAKLQFPHPITREKLSFSARPHGKFTEVLGLLEILPHEEVGNAF